jgi:hypothetical protein
MLHIVEVQYKLSLVFRITWSRNSSVDVVTRLRAGRSGFRIPAGVRDGSSFKKRPTRLCGAHPASSTVDTGSFSWVKRPGREGDRFPSSVAEVKNEWSWTSSLHIRLSGVDRDFFLYFTLPVWKGLIVGTFALFVINVDSHSRTDDFSSLLECRAVLTAEYLPKFRRGLVPPFSGCDGPNL